MAAALAAKSPVEVPDGPTPPGSAEWARWFGTEEVEGDNLKKHHEYQGHGGGYPPELAAYFVQCRVEGARWNDKTGPLDDQGDFAPTEALRPMSARRQCSIKAKLFSDPHRGTL